MAGQTPQDKTSTGQKPEDKPPVPHEQRKDQPLKEIADEQDNPDRKGGPAPAPGARE
ncbi:MULTISPECIES: hypothetical protein [Haematobacter]|uniref:hypothetical protein n=1 Tax=Haematobacter TaxID=366614 RepID=UPI0015C696DD|nr:MULTISPECIES: hypothetical protein [Haematobacter]